MISATILIASNSQDFINRLLQDYGVAVTESRGRWSYLHPDRTKPITDRKLGDDYRKEFIENVIREQNNRANITRDIGTTNIEQEFATTVTIPRASNIYCQSEEGGMGEQFTKADFSGLRTHIGENEKRTKRIHRNTIPDKQSDSKRLLQSTSIQPDGERGNEQEFSDNDRQCF